MPRPFQRIQIYALQDRRPKRGWVVRWSVDGRQRARSFPRKGEAGRYRSELYRAHADGARFDPSTGEPESWQQPLADLGLHEWARRWLAGEWPEWAPRTRRSNVEALARFVARAGDPRSRPPVELRRYLHKALPPGTEPERDPGVERWLERHAARLAELDR